MDKALAALALATSAIVAIFVVIFSGEIYIVPPLLAIAASVLAFVRRGPEGIAVGAVLLVAGLVGIFLALGAFTFKGGAAVDTGSSNYIGWAAAATAALLVPAAVAFLARDDVEPWMPIASGVGVVLALVFLWIGASRIGEFQAWTNWVVALGALVAAVPAFGRMRVDPTTHHESRTTG